MKKRCCLFIIIGLQFLCLIGAAEEYSSEDYTTFVAMQCIADAHFECAEQINQQLLIEAKQEDKLLCPGAYWFSDQRKTEPDPTQTMSLSQGLLFNMKTCTLYSRLGAWCFSSETMYKLAHSHCVPRTPKTDVWESFITTLLNNYHIDLSKRQDPHEEYIVHSFHGFVLPPVIFEEPSFGVPAIPVSASEDISVFGAHEPLPDPLVQPETSRVTLRGIFAFFSRWIDRLRTPRPVEPSIGMSDEMISVLEIAHVSSASGSQSSQHCAPYTQDQERFLAIWREMKRRHKDESLS